MNLHGTITLDDQTRVAVDSVRANAQALRNELTAVQAATQIRSDGLKDIAPAAVISAIREVTIVAQKAAEAGLKATEALDLKEVVAPAHKAAAAIKEVAAAANEAGRAGENASRKLRLATPRAITPYRPDPVRHRLAFDPNTPAAPEHNFARRRGPDLSYLSRSIAPARAQLGALNSTMQGLRSQGFAAMEQGVATLNPRLGMLTRFAGAATGPLLAVGAAAGVAAMGISKAAEMEDFETSFVTLLGSTAAAKQRLEELADFAATTPFELPEVARASKVLQTLTGGALATGAGLRLVGDVAANTGQPFGDLAVWIGRLYDGLQSGRPVGEAMMRLQELGVMSGTVRNQIEKLQAEGKKGDAVWGVAAASFGKFAGEMDRRSDTLNGRLSNLKDGASAFLREIGGPLMQSAKDGVGNLAGALDIATSTLKTFKQTIGNGLGIEGDPTSGAGIEGVIALQQRARTLETVAQREQLIFDIRKQITQLEESASNNPGLDFSQAINSANGLLKVVQGINAALLKNPEALAAQVAAEKKALDEANETAPQNRAALAESARSMDQARATAAMQAETDPNRREALAQKAAWTIGRGTNAGAAFQGEAGSLALAKERLELAMRLTQEQAKDPMLLEVSAESARKISAAYEDILRLQKDVTDVRSRAVDDELTSFFGPLDAASKKNHASDALRGTSEIASDRLSRIGGTVGAVGGPAIDFARRTASASEKTARAVEKIATQPSVNSAPTVAVYA